MSLLVVYLNYCYTVYLEKVIDMKRCNIIDFVKFISVILVIIIYTRLLANINSEIGFILTNIISRMVVSFFIVCPGFFIGKRVEETSMAYDEKLIFKY